MNCTKSKSQRRNFLPAKLTYEKATDAQLGSPVAAIEAGAGPSGGGSRISGGTKEHRSNKSKEKCFLGYFHRCSEPDSTRAGDELN
jgi:hypothetical protein